MENPIHSNTVDDIVVFIISKRMKLLLVLGYNPLESYKYTILSERYFSSTLLITMFEVITISCSCVMIRIRCIWKWNSVRSDVFRFSCRGGCRGSEIEFSLAAAFSRVQCSSTQPTDLCRPVTTTVLRWRVYLSHPHPFHVQIRPFVLEIARARD